MTLGIEPTRPETGYGYIEAGRPIAGAAPPAHWVRRFHEKPAAAEAKRYVASGRYVWNSGMFVWKASVFQAAVEQCAPRCTEALHGVWRIARAACSSGCGAPIGSCRRSPSTWRSCNRSRVCRRRRRGSPWCAPSSIGTMSAVGWRCPTCGGATPPAMPAFGKLVAVDAGDSIVYSPDRLVALLGVRNLIVVDSPDAVLICPRERAQEVREVTRELQRRGWGRYL